MVVGCRESAAHRVHGDVGRAGFAASAAGVLDQLVDAAITPPDSALEAERRQGSLTLASTVAASTMARAVPGAGPAAPSGTSRRPCDRRAAVRLPRKRPRRSTPGSAVAPVED